MEIDFQKALSLLDNVANSGSKYELKRIKLLCECLGNPHKKNTIIHITGTKGKGSTGAIISGLLSCKYKTGFFSSPHVFRITERFRINNKEISQKEFSKYFSDIWPCVLEVEKKTGQKPSYFETLTALAYYIFSEKGLDFSIMEVGLGGRLDATNIGNGIFCIFTRIHYDHTKVLGPTLRDIAREKAGIIKNDSFVVYTNREKEIVDEIKKTAQEKKAKVFYAPYYFNVIRKKEDFFGQTLDIYEKNKDFTIKNANFPLIGKHQIENLKLALKTLSLMKNEGYINEIPVEFQRVSWPGRLQVVKKEPLVLIDGAHNEISGKRLVEFLKKQGHSYIFLIGMLRDKDYISFIKNILPIADNIVLTEVESERKLDIKEMKNEVSKLFNPKNLFVERDNQKAYEVALKLSKNSKLPLIVTGSLYLIGNIEY